LGYLCCCRLGSNVKVINCVLMDNISIGDGSHIQNSIICSGAAVQERCSLKDCQVRSEQHRRQCIAEQWCCLNRSPVSQCGSIDVVLAACALW
jgi:ADP-glucose pyrophosphorylase